jgi:hypothetical protein
MGMCVAIAMPPTSKAVASAIIQKYVVQDAPSFVIKSSQYLNKYPKRSLLITQRLNKPVFSAYCDHDSVSLFHRATVG